MEIDEAGSILEMEHHPEGVMFFSNGLHPERRGEDGPGILTDTQ